MELEGMKDSLENLSELDDDDSGSESDDSVIPSMSGRTHRCGCISTSAKTFRSVSKTVSCFLHDRVDLAVHLSHSQEGITTLSLSHRHLGPDAFLPIAACLQSRPMISILDLSYNSLGEKGCTALVLSLVTNPYVTELDISGNKLGGHKAPAYLAVLLAENNILHKLNLSSNEFTDRDALFIASGILENNYLRELILRSNYIEEKGAGYLGRALAINNSLDQLDLSANCIRTDGAVYIGKAVMSNFALTEIDLSSNGLGYHGALAIREGLIRNTVLKKLDISNNRINWEGALVLAHGLEMNKKLEYLAVGDNPLTTTGCMDLIDSISINCSLKTLDIKKVNIVKEFKHVVRSIQERHGDFQVIHGLVVATHDVLGFRKMRDIHPMAHIVRYLLDKELRPVELIRIMDKTVSFKLTTKEFFSRCLSLGINIKTYERTELLEYIMAESSDKQINYATLLSSIEKYIEQEKSYRIRQRKKLQALTQYQQHLLDRHLPQVSIRQQINQLTDDLLDELSDGVGDKHNTACKRLTRSVEQLQKQKKISPALLSL